MHETDAPAPDPQTVIEHIRRTWPEVDMVHAMNAWFFSLDPERHFPNFATIVTTDEHDTASDLGRPGVYRLNIGVDRETFERLIDPAVEPDHAALDTILPHPVYAAQRWICVLSPSATTWRSMVIPLLGLAHDRLADQRARHGEGDGAASRRDGDTPDRATRWAAGGPSG